MPTRRARPPGADAGLVADRLHSAAIHLLRRLRREDDASRLSAPRLSVLSVVVAAGAPTLGALATAEQVRPPTMTRLVAALEDLGLVAREPDATDGRQVRVRATAKGRAVLARGRARRVDVLADRLRALDPAELGALDETLAVIERVVRTLP
ncbi:MAG: MarR family transcriptional regulator [Gemmatimonadaceae bacterium]